MNNGTINWDAVPDTLSKEQFYRLCHISKTTALHLLASGKVPCAYNGKMTRCYAIKKADVRAYLENRAIFPESYSAPEGWYCGKYKSNAHALPPKVTGDMTQFYTEKLMTHPDVLTVAEVCAFTGYTKSTVGRWCRLKYLKCFGIGKFYIPKVYLIEFLNSIHFRAINIKSKKHIAMLFAFRAWQKARAVGTPDEQVAEK